MTGRAAQSATMMVNMGLASLLVGDVAAAMDVGAAIQVLGLCRQSILGGRKLYRSYFRQRRMRRRRSRRKQSEGDFVNPAHAPTYMMRDLVAPGRALLDGRYEVAQVCTGQPNRPPITRRGHSEAFYRRGSNTNSQSPGRSFTPSKAGPLESQPSGKQMIAADSLMSSQFIQLYLDYVVRLSAVKGSLYDIETISASPKGY